MTPQQVSDQLEAIRLEDDFASASGDLTEAWSSTGVGFESIEPVLRFMEGHPAIDYGAPGPLVHFVERFYGTGYEVKLVESIQRRPTSLTVWMLNRLINGTKEPDRRREFVGAMEGAKRNPQADQTAVQMADRFLEMLAN